MAAGKYIVIPFWYMSIIPAAFVFRIKEVKLTINE